MYTYFDRPVISLDAAERLFLDAFRAWAFARQWQRDPIETLGQRIPLLRDSNALDLIDAIMTALDGSDTALALRRPCHETVDDDEAILLAVCRLTRDGRALAASATLARLVDQPAADRVALLLTEAWSRVSRAATVAARR